MHQVYSTVKFPLQTETGGWHIWAAAGYGPKVGKDEKAFEEVEEEVGRGGDPRGIPKPARNTRERKGKGGGVVHREKEKIQRCNNAAHVRNGSIDWIGRGCKSGGSLLQQSKDCWEDELVELATRRGIYFLNGKEMRIEGNFQRRFPRAWNRIVRIVGICLLIRD